MELLGLYDRMEYFNMERKVKVGEAVNYSVLSGLIVANRVARVAQE